MTPAGRPFAVTEKVLGDVVVVRGEQDLATASALTEALRRAGAHPGTQIRVELHAVTFMDCAGMRPLVEARESLGDRVCLWNPSPAVTRLLRLTGVLDTFKVILDPMEVAEYCGPLARSPDAAVRIGGSRPALAARSVPGPADGWGSASPRRPPQGLRRRWWFRQCGAKTAVAVKIRALTEAGSGETNE